MAILGPNTDYSDADFDSICQRLFALIRSVFPNWTEQNVANFGNIMIEMFCFVGDVTTKYQNNQARESRWTQATQRKNVIALAKLIGFAPSGATASQADIQFTIEPVAGGTTFPAGTVVKTLGVVDPVEFQLLTAAFIPAGQTTVTVTAENSVNEEDAFESDNSPDLQLQLTSTPYLDESEVVTAGNGTFTQVSSFLDSTSSDLHYTLTVDQNDRATITFGNGVNGATPSGTVEVTYKTGGGSAGRVDANSIVKIEGSFTDEFGNVVLPEVTNPLASSPAVDRQSVPQMQIAAPESIRVVNRTVSREDYEINARRLPDVARALMLTSDQDTAIDENTGFLFIVPEGGGTPTQQLLDDVLTQVTVTFPNTITFKTFVVSALYKPVDIAATVFLEKGADPTTVTAAINANLTAFFQVSNEDGTPNENVGFGYDYVEDAGASFGVLPLSDIYNVVRDTTGVRKISFVPSDFTLNGLHEDVEFLLREFLTLGTVTLTNGDTGAAL